MRKRTFALKSANCLFKQKDIGCLASASGKCSSPRQKHKIDYKIRVLHDLVTLFPRALSLLEHMAFFNLYKIVKMNNPLARLISPIGPARCRNTCSVGLPT